MSPGPSQQDERLPKVLMLGPQLTDQGGMATVAQTLIGAWRHDRYHLKYLGTFNTNIPQIAKLFLALRAYLYFLYLLLVWRPRIIHVHFAAGVSFLRKSIFIVTARLTPAKIVLHSHAPDFDAFYEHCSRALRAYLRMVLNAADILVALSESWRSYFQGLSPSVPVVKLYNAVACPPEIHRPPEANSVVLTLGRLGRRKGTYDILQAIPAVLEKCPDTEFWLAGDGEVERIRDEISQRPWAGHVRLLGWVSGREKDEALRRAAVFLLPSYQEGFPVAILEAMAYGLPAVCSNVGGIPELIEEGVTGFMINPGAIEEMSAKLVALLQDSELRERLGRKGRERVGERFSLDGMMRELFAIYESILKTPPR